MGCRRATPRHHALAGASTSASPALSASAPLPLPPPPLLLLLLLLPEPCRADDNGVNGMWPVLGVALATFLCLSICFSCCKVYFIRRRMEDEAAATRARAARDNLSSPYIVVAMISRDYERQPRGRPGERPLRPFVAGRPPRLPPDLGGGQALPPPPSYQEATAAPPPVFPDEPPPRYSVASGDDSATPVARGDVTSTSGPQQRQHQGGAAVRV
ncbi:uncharacterized protein LOC126088482 [Schistocerca cancellata]|uniref:uncharacterized protein LOC126088482 n=1 Tax=Schistocerca cancellata TaxID=274614 RepID=UPI002117E79D|nr:uncharacterized protein LOC126088482 [Schistocerca cancellata]